MCGGREGRGDRERGEVGGEGGRQLEDGETLPAGGDKDHYGLDKVLSVGLILRVG